mmetsp:Transcript_13457/g.19397  ORF Transcript_13457/g.19397 Transcript_13457/m.19397 type:complete len:95 (+) Transcript_13457:461-745(+)
MDQQYGEQLSHYNMRPRKPHDYSHLHTNTASLATEQISMKKGLKLFCTEGIKAVRKELHQIHDWDVITPINKHSLSCSELLKVLHYLMFLSHQC